MRNCDRFKTLADAVLASGLATAEAPGITGMGDAQLVAFAKWLFAPAPVTTSGFKLAPQDGFGAPAPSVSDEKRNAMNRLYTLTVAVRKAQKAYFAERTETHLRASKAAERQLDDFLAQLRHATDDRQLSLSL